jgi:hypothetical protein
MSMNLLLIRPIRNTISQWAKGMVPAYGIMDLNMSFRFPTTLIFGLD